MAEVREALEDVCQKLKCQGILVDPKVLHRAKQNDLSVLPQMWALIIDLLKLDQVVTEGTAAVEQLGLLGYPRVEELQTDASKSNSGLMGPELLLSFAFLLDHLKLMEPSPRRVPMRLPPYPQDISGESAKEENVGTCREKSRNVSVHAILQLHTKYQNTMRRLQGLEVHRLQLLHVLQQLGRQRLESEHVGEGKKLKTPPTQYELFVLERPRLLQSHLEDLQEHLQITQGLKHQEVFWRWMGSVLRSVTDASAAAPQPGSTRSTAKESAKESAPRVQRPAKTGDDRCASFQKSLERLKAHEKRPELRERWQLHKSLPEEIQQSLRVELHRLGQAFDDLLPSPWKTPPTAPPRPERPTLRAEAARASALASRGVLQEVAEVRERYSLASQRWSAQRSCAEAKLEQLLSSGPAGTAGLSAVWTVGVKAAEKKKKKKKY